MAVEQEQHSGRDAFNEIDEMCATQLMNELMLMRALSINPNMIQAAVAEPVLMRALIVDPMIMALVARAPDEERLM